MPTKRGNPGDGGLWARRLFRWPCFASEGFNGNPCKLLDILDAGRGERVVFRNIVIFLEMCAPLYHPEEHGEEGGRS